MWWEDKDILKITNHYGAEHQKRKAAEELCELTVEILKDVSGHGNREHIIEEMADALIMLNQLRIIYDCAREMFEVMGAKIERTLKRMENDDTGTA